LALTLAGLWLSLVAIASAGCGGASEAGAAEAEAAVSGPTRFIVVNRSTGEIRDIAVKANIMIRFRDLSRGESSTMKDPKLSVPSSLAIRWTDHRGEHHYARRDTGSLGGNPSTARFVIDQANHASLGP
jgi:hypothetical protein